MRGKGVVVTRRIFRLEDLRAEDVAQRKADEHDGEDDGLLRLSRCAIVSSARR